MHTSTCASEEVGVHGLAISAAPVWAITLRCSYSVLQCDLVPGGSKARSRSTHGITTLHVSRPQKKQGSVMVNVADLGSLVRVVPAVDVPTSLWS
ncbi:unnamed protein product [Pleuronectes platessa]|uniref:Uncharacterized protein n=1 Tax=Pleuronectes platessa TaxID=8262 RepID=A0A9N7V316_PLEPL|nr:unnamed protein product [Pleuronectes platessa]